MTESIDWLKAAKGVKAELIKSMRKEPGAEEKRTEGRNVIHQW